MMDLLAGIHLNRFCLNDLCSATNKQLKGTGTDHTIKVLERRVNLGMLLSCLNRKLIEFSLAENLVTCLRMSTACIGDFFKETHL